MPVFPYNRIVIVGATSSGKSTLAEKLARRFGLHFIELDALHWEPNWQEAPLDVFRARVEKAINAEKWVVAGNYHIVRDIIWPKAEAIIWLDYPFRTVLWQLTRRTFTRWWTQELLWGTNREPLIKHFKLWSDDSLFHWLFKTYWRRKREIPVLLVQPEHQHLTLLRFQDPRETNEWLENLQETMETHLLLERLDEIGCGEKLSAMRFIQGHAVDCLLELAQYIEPGLGE